MSEYSKPVPYNPAKSVITASNIAPKRNYKKMDIYLLRNSKQISGICHPVRRCCLWVRRSQKSRI